MHVRNNSMRICFDQVSLLMLTMDFKDSEWILVDPTMFVTDYTSDDKSSTCTLPFYMVNFGVGDAATRICSMLVLLECAHPGRTCADHLRPGNLESLSFEH